MAVADLGSHSVCLLDWQVVIRQAYWNVWKGRPHLPGTEIYCFNMCTSQKLISPGLERLFSRECKIPVVHNQSSFQNQDTFSHFLTFWVSIAWSVHKLSCSNNLPSSQQNWEHFLHCCCVHCFSSLRMPNCCLAPNIKYNLLIDAIKYILVPDRVTHAIYMYFSGKVPRGNTSPKIIITITWCYSEPGLCMGRTSLS